MHPTTDPYFPSPAKWGTRPRASKHRRNKQPTVIPTSPSARLAMQAPVRRAAVNLVKGCSRGKQVAACFFLRPVPRDAPPRSGGTPQLPWVCVLPSRYRFLSCTPLPSRTRKAVFLLVDPVAKRDIRLTKERSDEASDCLRSTLQAGHAASCFQTLPQQATHGHPDLPEREAQHAGVGKAGCGQFGQGALAR